jgi:hypothetical protein
MRFRYRVTVFVVSAGAALLSPVSRAAHPRILPGSAAQTAHSGTKEYQFTTFDVPDALVTFAGGINNPGVVPGFYVVHGHAHGFVAAYGARSSGIMQH